MKNLFLLICFVIATTSCSVYEDITFHKNGKIDYKLIIDGKELLTMIPDLNAEKISDKFLDGEETISIAEKLKESLDEITPETEAYLKALEPLYISYTENIENQELMFSLFGNFKDADAFNNAYNALLKLQENRETSLQEGIDGLFGRSNLYWDGKTMKRFVQEDIDRKTESDEENLDFAGIDLLKGLFGGGKMQIKYHFSEEVSTINNPDALLNQNRKTVVLEHPADVFFDSGEQLNIEIKVNN